MSTDVSQYQKAVDALLLATDWELEEIEEMDIEDMECQLVDMGYEWDDEAGEWVKMVLVRIPITRLSVGGNSKRG